MTHCEKCKTKKDKDADTLCLTRHSLVHKYDPEKTLAPIQRKLFYDILDGKVKYTSPIKFIMNLQRHSQWTHASYNIMQTNYACRNDCVYCYVKPMNLRFGRDIEDIEDVFRVADNKVTKKWTKSNKPMRYMFPSTHDIFPEMVEDYIAVAKNIMNAGHTLLCVTKPRIDSVRRLCDEFNEYKDKLTFRFTIGSDDNTILKLWEPNAPTFEERVSALKLAYQNGYKTSVSMEPFLSDPVRTIDKVKDYVNDHIWIGAMNYMASMEAISDAEKHRVNELYTQENLMQIVSKLRKNDNVYWKSSVFSILLKSKKTNIYICAKCCANIVGDFFSDNNPT